MRNPGDLEAIVRSHKRARLIAAGHVHRATFTKPRSQKFTCWWNFDGATIAATEKLMKRLRIPPGRGSPVMEASRRYRHYSPL